MLTPKEHCAHPRLERPAFDPEAAKNLSADEVKERWPRKHARCPDCGSYVVMYASEEHFILGDW